MKNKQEARATKIRYSGNLITLLLFLTSVFACSDKDKNNDGQDMPYDPDQKIQLTSFYPDSGGMATNVVIEGYNFGTDPKKVKVYYNEKQAAVVTARGNKLYAITPRQPGADCVISVVVGKDSVCFENTFKYKSVTRVTTVAGNPNRDAVADGSLISAGFQDPRYLTIDAEDNIFVCEWSNSVLRRVNLKKGEVSTIKGSGFVGGFPNMPSVDSEGKVVIIPMDFDYTFYEFDPERLWEGRKFEITIAEDSKYFKSQYKHSVAACQLDHMMYSRSLAGELYKFDPKTKQAWLVAENVNTGSDGFGAFSPTQPNLLFYTYWNSRHIGVYDILTNQYKPYTGYGQIETHRDGELSDAAFGQLQQMCFDEDGNIFVADATNHCIRKISVKEGVVTTVIGIPGKSGYKDGNPDEALFNKPSGLAVLGDGTIYIADRENNCIRKLAIE